MGSSRLPGKSLSEVYNRMHLLECVVRRFKLASCITEVVVATTKGAGDDPIAEWCKSHGVNVHRGSEEDVLDRVAGTALAYGADVIVQMGADSAYLDYSLIDQLVVYYQKNEFDYVCNDLKLTYPLGIYAHVVNAKKLIELNGKTDLSSEDREDVVRYLWEHPDQYRLCNIEAGQDFRYPELRLTVDYPEDLSLARNIYRHFGGYRFTTSDIVALYRQDPALFAGTRNLVQHSAPFLSKQHEA